MTSGKGPFDGPRPTNEFAALLSRVAAIEADAHLSRQSVAILQQRVVELERALMTGPTLPAPPAPPPALAAAAVVPAPPPELAPPWLTALRAKLGEREIEGPGSNPWIAEVLATVRLVGDDSKIPWCSATIAWAMLTSGQSVEGVTGMARSWLRWGREIASPVLGCVTVLSRPPDPSSGHVGLYLRENDAQICLLGGNQHNRVSEAWFPRARLLSYRMPR